MITKIIKVNGTEFKLTLTDQIISYVNNLKNLYNDLSAYEDPESFEEVSAEISSTITEIARAVEPEASDNDLDGLIQEIIRVVDNKAYETKQELEEKPEKVTTKKTGGKNVAAKKPKSKK